MLKDTNHIFINILSHQDLKREKTTDLDSFLNFDLELQMYFSNSDNVVYNVKNKQKLISKIVFSFKKKYLI